MTEVTDLVGAREALVGLVPPTPESAPVKAYQFRLATVARIRALEERVAADRFRVAQRDLRQAQASVRAAEAALATLEAPQGVTSHGRAHLGR